MECVLSICVLVLFRLRLTGAVEHSVGIGPEDSTNTIRPELTQSPVCSKEIDLD